MRDQLQIIKPNTIALVGSDLQHIPHYCSHNSTSSYSEPIITFYTGIMGAIENNRVET